RADDGGYAELARDDRRMRERAADVGDDRGRGGEERYPRDVRRLADEHVAPVETRELVELADEPRRTARDPRGCGGAVQHPRWVVLRGAIEKMAHADRRRCGAVLRRIRGADGLGRLERAPPSLLLDPFGDDGGSGHRLAQRPAG